VFNVAINGTQVLSNFDITAQAGAAFKALDRSFPLNVTGGSISIAFSSLVDNATISAIQIAPATAPPPSSVVTRINAGGSSYTDPQGQTWNADTGFTGGFTYTTSVPIQNTTSQPLYQATRYGSTFSYQFSVPNGNYTVTLKFAEPFFSAAGSRIFNVAINGTQVLSNFDITAQAGAAFKALDRSFPVSVTGGSITIAFSSLVNFATVSGIQITAP